MGNIGGDLTFIVVPDIAADRSLDEAMKRDVEYIIHTDATRTVSSTITAERYESQIMQPLLKGANNVLSAAFSKSSIKQVVMTSSRMTIVPYQELFVLESFATFNEASTALRQRIRSFACWESKGTCGDQFVFGQEEATFYDHQSHIHALALDNEKVAKNQNFLLTSDGMNGSPWYRVKEIVKKEYMDAVKRGWLTLDGEQPINRVMVDNGKTIKAFNIKFAGFDKQICSLLD
ncbi:MAG: hypothetical protein Q9176_005333 [Flavoplaca citrina]